MLLAALPSVCVVVSNDIAGSTDKQAKPGSSGSGFLRNRTNNNKPAQTVVLDTSLAGNFHNPGVVTARPGVPSERDYPATKLNVVSADGKTGASSDSAVTYAKWLEDQYHANVAPFSFLGEVPLQLIDMPEQAVVDLAIKMLKARGWQVSDLVEFKASGTRAGSITLMHPHSTGF